jgi:nitronate monooxygenase
MDKNKLLERLGIEHPVILAPIAGGPGTPELVAAVSNAGGLGSLGAAYLKPSEITEAAKQIRELTDQPFCINLFAGGYSSERAGGADAMLEVLAPIHEALGLPPPTVPIPAPDPFLEQLEAVLEARPVAGSRSAFPAGTPCPAFARVASRSSGRPPP